MSDEAEVRDLFERASRLEGALPVDDAWAAGRRRRTGKRVGAAVVTGVAVAAVGGLVWQSGLLGGSDEDLVAGFPRGTTTFVFAAPGAGGVADPDAVDTLRAATESDLAGTSWDLQDEVWGGGASAGVIGSAADTELVFPVTGAGWGVTVEDCGGAARQEVLELGEGGGFAAGDLATTDLGCPQEVQAAEDFWMEALAGSGSLRLVDGDAFLLLTVPVTGGAADPVAATEPPAEETLAPTGTEGPGPSTGIPSTTEEPVVEPTTDAAEPTPEPTTAPEPSVDTPTDPATPSIGQEPGGDRAWLPVDGATEGGGGLASSGQLLAPTVRAGRHDGFDRVVVDLTGTGSPGWVADYVESASEDGSGSPIEVAGDSLLRLRLSGMAYPEPGDPVYDGGIYGLDTHSLGVVVEVMRTTPFEGQVQLLVGMTGDPRPYDVFVLEDPLRLVVDVRTTP